jgi:hypothetical protein
MVQYGYVWQYRTQFMPPFGGSLTDRQRWDVVAYIYTLSMQPNQLAEGAELYAGMPGLPWRDLDRAMVFAQPIRINPLSIGAILLAWHSCQITGLGDDFRRCARDRYAGLC